MQPLPDIEILWDFADVAASEARFREWLAIAEKDTSGRSDYYALELKTQIARTYSLLNRFDEAHILLDEVEPQATIFPQVNIRYLLERGRTYNSSQQPEKAKPLFYQAWEIARKSGSDYLAIDAAHMIAIAEPDLRQQIIWQEKALELTEASQQPHVDKWHGALYNNLGWTYHDMGEYDKALDLFQKGVSWREKQGSIAPLRIAKWAVGRALRSLQRYDEALALQEKLLADYQSTGDEDGFVYEELGECLLALNRSDEAKLHFAKAYELLKTVSWLEADRIERLRNLGA